MLPRFCSELPEPDRGSVRRSGSGSGVGPNLAEPFRTGSEPQTRRSKPPAPLTTRHPHSTTISCNPQRYALCCVARHAAERLQPSTSLNTVLRTCGTLWGARARLVIGSRSCAAGSMPVLACTPSRRMAFQGSAFIAGAVVGLIFFSQVGEILRRRSLVRYNVQ